ncbi:MAG TPA: hypothetical protein VFT53_00460 [Candidatus Saccharimonadales bacterium]|nr:hypothetical protein [Candidatus Saccharimonadales bacterium]
MAWSISNAPYDAGFTLVEALLASLLFGLVATAMAGALVYGRTATANAGDHQRAMMLADEGLQAARNIRDAAYGNLDNGIYGLSLAGGTWTLSGTSDQTGIFNRSISISDAGTNRKQVVSTVTWSKGSVTARGQFSNWRAAIVSSPSWRRAILAGSFDISSVQDGIKVATQGDYAYIIRANGSPNFAIINIHTPSAPALVGSLNLAGAPTNIALGNGYAYVTNGQNSGEVQTVSISDPAAPLLTATTNLVGNADATSIYTSGAYAYVSRMANGNSGEFVVLSLANPAIPTIAGSYSSDINMRDAYVSGNYAYVATEADAQELLVISVATPAAPQLVATLDLPGTTNTTAITGSGSYIYIGQGGTLRVIDIASPTAPTLTGSYSASGAINDLAANTTDPTFVFMATGDTAATFQVADVGNPANPTLARSIGLGSTGFLQGVALNASLNVVVGASTADSQEGVVFAPN